MAGYLGSVPVPQATQHRETFTATAGQTSFATAGYTPQFIDVYLNGVHLSPADVTATNGSDVVLAACLVNDIVDVVSYTPFEVASQTFTGTTTMDVATITGVVTANAGVVVDNFTLDGTTLALSSGDFTLDGAGEINLDAATAGVVRLKKAGTQYGTFFNSSDSLVIKSQVNDKDIIFQGNNSSGSGFTALTLDISDAGTATFNHDIKLASDGAILNIGAGNDLKISHSGSAATINNDTGDLSIQTDGNLKLEKKDGGEDFIHCIADGAVELHHNGSIRFATTSYGSELTASDSGVAALRIRRTDISDSDVDLKTGGGSDGKAFDISVNQANRMRIDSNGNILIGNTNTNPIGNHIPQVMLNGPSGSHFHRDDGVAVKIGRNDANECTEFFRNGGTQGGISLTSSGVTYNSDSDYRLKENVTYTWDATTRFKQLKPAQFNFISVPDETMNGFLAHEVQAVVSDAVSGVKDAVDGDGNIKAQRIDHSRLVPLLVKTIQELEARITALEG